MATPVRIHPSNPRCFEFRGEPLMLVTATEHYGAVMNRPFRFERYLADAADKSQTLTRLFVLFRELQNQVNPYSTCKPESPDYIAPFRRTGPGNAHDCQPKYDLDQWNPEFFDRLHGFLSLASGYGIIVELVLLSNTYADGVWSLNPLFNHNNINGLPEIPWPDYMSLRHPKILERQLAHVRKIVAETNSYDNLFYEICNEPGGCFNGVPNSPTLDEVNAWEAEIARVIRDTESHLPNQHLIAGHEAFSYDPWEHKSDKTFHDFPVDIVNIHPLPGITYGGKTFDLGTFMSKQLRLRAFRDYCLETRHETKPLNLDEDNVASQYKDVDGWTIHRKRAWTALLCGCHYDYIDFSIINYCEIGTEASQKHIRSWMKHLSEFVHSMDLGRARPLPGWVTAQPKHTCESVLAVEGEDYAIYLADERELTESGVGDSIQGEIGFTLPKGDWRIAAFSPTTGLYSPWITIKAGATRITTPTFRHDLVLRMTRA